MITEKLNGKKLSIVVPCYNEEEMIELFFSETEKVLSNKLPNIQVEYIFVNDGSTDKTLYILRDLNSKSEKVKYLSFSKNFGKESALYAGLKQTTGEFVTVMDVDLQDPPEMLPEMFDTLIKNDVDCIGTRRITRKGEPPVRSFFARQFYRVINRISDVEIVDGARDYRLMTRQMVEAILDVSEYNRFSKGIFSWVGFDTIYLEYTNKERVAGETTWSFWGLLKYSLDGIVAFSEAPLAIASFIGFLSFAGSILLALFFAIRTIIFENPTSGWTSLMVMMLGLGGLQLLCLGILGKYLGKTFVEVKKRPIYIVKESSKNIKFK